LMTLKYIFSLGCHFHVDFSYPWHAFALHCLPAIAELVFPDTVYMRIIIDKYIKLLGMPAT